MSERLAEIKNMIADVKVSEHQYEAQRLDRVKAVQAIVWLLADAERLEAANQDWQKSLAACTDNCRRLEARQTQRHTQTVTPYFNEGMERAAVIIDAMGQPKEGSAAIRAEINSGDSDD